MAVHGMIDLETLGVEPDSVIITLGAIKFDPYTDEDPHSGLYLRCDIEEQSEKYHRTIDENTLGGETKALDFLSNTIDKPIMQWKSGGVISSYIII